jgi:hypothetical protein
MAQGKCMLLPIMFGIDWKDIKTWLFVPPRWVVCLLCKRMHVWNNSIQGRVLLVFFCYVLLHSTTKLTINRDNTTTNVPYKLSENKNTSPINHIFLFNGIILIIH